MANTRIERDSMGEMQVPADALYGAQTQRAVNNFERIGGPMPERFIAALLLVKAAAARAQTTDCRGARLFGEMVQPAEAGSVARQRRRPVWAVEAEAKPPPARKETADC